MIITSSMAARHNEAHARHPPIHPRLRAAFLPRWSELAATGVPLARWSGPELAAELTKAGLARPISPSSVLRILAEHQWPPGPGQVLEPVQAAGGEPAPPAYRDWLRAQIVLAAARGRASAR